MSETENVVDWIIDTGHSTFEFTVRQVVVSTIKGAFGGVTGTIRFDPNDLASCGVHAVVDIATLNSNNKSRDERLMGEAFFDVANFPTATFASSRVERRADSRYDVTGDLTLRGVTREVVFDADFVGTAHQADGVLRGAFVALATIKRADFGFGLGSPLPGGGWSHSDEVGLAMYTTIKPAPRD